jgi:hypothetical protein
VSADNASLITYTVCLCPDCTVGTPSPGYALVEAVDTRGGTHYLLAYCDAIGDERVRYDPTCSDVAHEQLGPLPKELLDDIADSTAYHLRRLRVRPIHRCGRPTCKGRPCRNRVNHPGQACEWHQQPSVVRCRWCAVPLQQPDSIARGLCGECHLTAETR